MLGLVNPPWVPSHRARRKPSGRNFLCVSLPQAVEEVGLWPSQYHKRKEMDAEGLASHGTGTPADLTRSSWGLPLLSGGPCTDGLPSPHRQR